MSRRQARGSLVLTFSGTIDETFHSSAVSELKGRTVLVDLSGAEKITSYGVRRWKDGFGAAGTRYLGFMKARPLVVSQFNSVAGFACGGELLSIYAPYACEACGHGEDVLVDLRLRHAEVRSFKLAEVRCEKCGAPTRFDDFPQTYFRYAALAPVPAPPLETSDVLTPTERVFQTEKDITETLSVLWLSGMPGNGARVERAASGLEGQVVLVMQDLVLQEESDLARLRPFFDAPQISLFLARVPLEVALLAGGFRERRAAQLLSVRVPVRCKRRCGLGLQSLEVDAGRQRELQALTFERACQECGGEVTAEVSEAAATLLRGLTFSDAPAEIGTYLSSHREAPRFDPARESGARQRIGKYELLTLLGQGGMAQVHLALQTGAGGFAKRVVIKQILPHLANDRTFVAMFLQEARLAARLDHPNVLQTLDVSEEGSKVFIALEYVRGSDLAFLIRCARLLTELPPIGVVLRIIADVCKALHAAHTAVDEHGLTTPIAHRDVSPQNILVSVEGNVKLGDFGIAKATDCLSTTPDGKLRGKLAYLAPEYLVEGQTTQPIQGDLFALGVVLYEALTLVHPFQQGSEIETIRALVNRLVPPPSLYRKDVSTQVDRVVARALEKSPADRYPSADQLGAEVETLLTQLEVPLGSSQVAEWVRSVTQRAADAGLTQMIGASRLLTHDATGADDKATVVNRPLHPLRSQ